MATKLFRFSFPLVSGKNVVFNPLNAEDDKALTALFQNNENGEGGWYPIGLNQTWHNGIHLSSKQFNTPVQCIGPGRIIAARLRPKQKEDPKSPGKYPFGHPQFVLVQHDVKARESKCLKEDDPAKWTFRSVKFYSLYMHLSLPATPTAEIPWLRSFLPFLGEQPEAKAEARDYFRVDVAKDALKKGGTAIGITLWKSLAEQKDGKLAPAHQLKVLKKGTVVEVLDLGEKEQTEEHLKYSKVKVPTEGNIIGWVRSDEKQLAALPDFSAQVQALESGGCAKLDYPVSSGERVGLMSPVKPAGSMVHLEIFSEENLVEADDMSAWHLFDKDTDEDPLCEINGLPENLTPLAYNSSALISAEEVKRSFARLTEDDRKYLRACITYNKSYWAIDWKDAKEKNKDWAKEFALTDEDVKEADALAWWKEAQDAKVPLPASPIVYHYHPLTLMKYLAERLPRPPLFYVERGKEEVIVAKPADLQEREKVYVYDLTVDSWRLGTQSKKGIFRNRIKPGEQDLYELLIQNEAAEYVPSLDSDANRIWASLWNSEGTLSSINTWDDSFLTFGPFQQTLGQSTNAGELPGVLAIIKAHPDGAALFKKYLEDYGLDVTEATGPEGMREGYLKLNGSQVKEAADKNTFRELIWGYRFVKAMEDPAFSKLFLAEGFKRLPLIRGLEYTFGEGQKYTLSQIHKSELAQALLLDAHINRPSYLSESTKSRPEMKAGLWAEPAKAVLGKLDKNALGSEGFKLELITSTHEFEMIKEIIKMRNASKMTHPAQRAAYIMLCVKGLDDDVAKACGYESVKDIQEQTGSKGASKYQYDFLGRPELPKPEEEEKIPGPKEN